MLMKFLYKMMFFLVCLVCVGCDTIFPSATPSPTMTPPVLPTQTRPPLPTPTSTPIVYQGTITLWHSWDETRVPTLVQIIRDFQAIYPDVQFNITYVPPEILRERYRTEQREGYGPTLLMGPDQWGPILYSEGQIADLTPQAPETLLKTISPPALQSVQQGDALIGLPYEMRGVVLYRNKALISQAPTTLDELITLARSATHADIIGAYLERSFFYSGAHLNGIGGRLMDGSGNPVFNDGKGLEWVDLLRRFEEAGPTEFMANRDLERFKAGKAGMIIDGTWNLQAIKDAIGGGNLAVDPWPSYRDGRLSGYVQSNSLYLNPNDNEDSRRAAWKFMEYMLSPAAQAVLLQAGNIPVVSEIQTSDPLVPEIMKALSGGVTYPPLPQMTLYESPIDAALKSIFVEKAESTDKLQAAQNEIQKALGEQSVPTAPTPTP
jgi:maltose-binding protein MalE